MITIIDSPASGSTVQDSLWHLVTSDSSGVTDFKYVFDVWINGEQKVRVKKFPEPSNGVGYFDAGPIVRNYMTYEWFEPLDTVLCTQPNVSGEVAISYDVRYGEDYTGVTTLNLASGTTMAYNWRPPLFKRRVTVLADKIANYFTNRPLVANAILNSTNRLMVPVYYQQEMFITVTTYDQPGNIIQTVTDYPSYGITIPNNFIQLNISPSAINNHFGTTVIDEAVSYYLLEFKGPTQDTLPFRVDLICPGVYTPMPLHFVNAWGMYDTALFNLVSRLNMEAERKSFTQRDYSFGSTSVEYYDTNNVYRESKINYRNKAVHSYKLTMDCPSDGDYQWLAELIMSPQIYLELDGYFYPVTIKTNNYEYSTIINNRMRPLEIEIDVNQTRYSQLR